MLGMLLKLIEEGGITHPTSCGGGRTPNGP